MSLAYVTEAGLLNFSGLQCLLGYFVWHTCPFLEPNLVTQTLNLNKSLVPFINVAELSDPPVPVDTRQPHHRH